MPPEAPRVDVHQHVWTEPLVAALAKRRALPFVRIEQGLTMLYLAGERPYVIDLDAEAPEWRKTLLQQDGVDRALVCLSTPLGIESLPREDATTLLDAYHRGALELGAEFGVWGALALEEPNPDDVDQLIESGCVGLSLPAASIGSIDGLQRLAPVLQRLEESGATLFVHPGGKQSAPARETSLADPLWWPALTCYVESMHAAWLAFVTAGRRSHPRLRVIFSMLAGLAPLQSERLHSRGAPWPAVDDPLVFYETSSYGPRAIGLLAELVGEDQLLYGSDRPVVDPHECGAENAQIPWERLRGCTESALGGKLTSAVALR